MKKSDWINIEEHGNPTTELPFYVVFKKGVYRYAQEAEYSNGKWLDQSGNDLEGHPDYYTATHYTNLPELPDE